MKTLLALATLTLLAHTVSAAQTGTPALWDQIWDQSKTDRKHRTLLLNRGDRAFEIRMNLIRSARRSIKIQTFIWKNDTTGNLAMAELLAAARDRNVRVDIIMDPVCTTVGPKWMARYAKAHPNLRIQIYSPIMNRLQPDPVSVLVSATTDFKKLNTRMHNKLMVVDDRVAITGGRNFSDEYFDHRLGMNFKDRDVMVLGPKVIEASNSFASFWESSLSVPALTLTDVAHAARRSPLAAPARPDPGPFQITLQQADDPSYIQTAYIERMLPVQRVQWLLDNPDKNKSKRLDGGGQVADMLQSEVLRADRSILIQTPYMALSPRAYRLFQKVRTLNPNMPIRVSTNSLAATDMWVAYGATHKQKRQYVQELGMDIREFKPHPQDIEKMMPYQQVLARAPRSVRRPSLPFMGNKSFIPTMCIHAKSMVVDGRAALVGSYNLDPRSGNLCTEIGLLVDDEAFAALLTEDIERDMAPRNSYLSAPKKPIRGFKTINDSANRLSEAMPVDIWPFRINCNYELRDGGQAVPYRHDGFHQHWKNVGDFPQVKPIGKKNLGAWMSMMFGNVMLPLL